MSSAWASSLAKMRVLGTSVRPGKISVKSLSLEGFDDGADLVRGDHVAVELVGIVGEVVVELFPSHLARVWRSRLSHVEAGVYLGASCGDGGADAVHVVVDVDAVGHGLLVAVFHDEVLIEEAEGLLVGRGGEADEEGIEVFQHLRPEVVDGPVAFIGDDDVEGLDHVDYPAGGRGAGDEACNRAAEAVSARAVGVRHRRG